jgi:hypothetical protein
MLTMKWVCGAVWVLYFILQIVAIRVSRGDLRRRCLIVLRVTVIAVLLLNGIRLLSDSMAAKRIELLVMGVLGVGAIAALARLFALDRHQDLLKADSG